MAKTATAAADDNWTVRDQNATRGSSRSHEAAPGHIYVLSAEGKGTPMPPEHAAVFLRDPAFIVQNENGQVIATMPQGAANSDGTAPTTLKPGEVLANIGELTRSALMARVRTRPGGERFTTKSTNEEMKAFLLAAADPMSAVRGVDAGAGTPVAEDPAEPDDVPMSGDDVSTMFAAD